MESKQSTSEDVVYTAVLCGIDSSGNEHIIKSTEVSKNERNNSRSFRDEAKQLIRDSSFDYDFIRLNYKGPVGQNSSILLSLLKDGKQVLYKDYMRPTSLLKDGNQILLDGKPFIPTTPDEVWLCSNLKDGKEEFLKPIPIPGAITKDYIYTAELCGFDSSGKLIRIIKSTVVSEKEFAGLGNIRQESEEFILNGSFDEYDSIALHMTISTGGGGSISTLSLLKNGKQVLCGDYLELLQKKQDQIDKYLDSFKGKISDDAYLELEMKLNRHYGEYYDTLIDDFDDLFVKNN